MQNAAHHRKRFTHNNRIDFPRKPRTLLYDLETSPILGYVWEKYETNLVESKRDWYIMSFSYKWLGGNTHVISLPDFPHYKKDPEDDTYVVRELWKLFDEADITIAHNNNGFDRKKSNARFIQLGFTPPSPYKVIDTLSEARKNFKFTSNKLDDLAQYLSIGRKVETGGYVLWRDCMLGKKEAWDRMRKYNRRDTDLLEAVYLKLLPWIDSHPKYGAWIGKIVCDKCGGDHMISKGYHVNRTKKMRRLKCQDCAGWQLGKL